MDRLAIILVGDQNTGKTTTLKEYSDYYHKKVGTFKKGWRYGLTPFKPKFHTIKSFAYILPGSPTETQIKLANTIDPQGWYPDILLMAEQLNGAEYKNSINYLRANEYHIKEFVLSNHTGIKIWDRWSNNAEMKSKLLYRREEIADYVRNFIISRI